MRDQQFELFEDEPLYDADDPPPQDTYSDLHWWFLNRWAEWGMRYARSLGLM